MNHSRRDWLRLAAALATTQSLRCRTPTRENGRIVATFWFGYGDRVRATLLELVRRFNQSQSHFLIRATYQGDYYELLAKLRTSLAAHASPTMSHVVGEVIPYLAQTGMIEALDGYPGARELPLVASLSQAASFVGGDRQPLIAIPFNRSTPVMYVNQNVLNLAGISAIPTSWDELRTVASSLTTRSRYGFEVPISWWFWVAMVGQAGGALTDSSGAMTLGGEAGVRALEFWQTLVHRDHSMRPPPGRDYDAWQTVHQDFLSERVAMIWSSSAFLRYLEDNARFRVVAAPLPRDQRASVPTGGTFFVTLRSAPSEEKQAAWAFIRWMCESEQTLTWARRTGYLPITQPAVETLLHSDYQSHPNDGVAYSQLNHVMPWPWAPDLFRVQRDVLEPRLEEAVLARRDAREILSQARLAARET